MRERERESESERVTTHRRTRDIRLPRGVVAQNRHPSMHDYAACMLAAAGGDAKPHGGSTWLGLGDVGPRAAMGLCSPCPGMGGESQESRMLCQLQDKEMEIGCDARVR